MSGRLAVYLLICLAASCSKAVKPGHYALIPAENLSGDDSLDWIATAVPILLTTQLEGLPKVEVSRAQVRRDAPADASPVLCRYAKQGERLALDCWLDGTTETLHSEGTLGQGLRTLVSPIGSKLNSAARPAAAVGNEALMALAAGRFQEATRLAPDLGLAYTEGATKSLVAGDRALAEKLIADGLARGSAIGEIERARLELLAGTLATNRRDQIAALSKLTSLVPSDADQWGRYAQLLLGTRKLTEAAAAQAKVAELQPENQTAWNLLGYYRAYAGDLAGAKQALDRYAQLAPNSPNPLDSLGEVHYYTGRFAEAEKYFLDSMAKDERFFNGLGYFKAAMARLRQGDQKTAADHYRKFVEGNEAGKGFLEAQWRYLTGDAAGAEASMRNAAASAKGELAAQSWSQAGFWGQLRGDPTAAQQAVRQALPLARTPLVRLGAQLTAFVSQPDTGAAGWADRAGKLVRGPDPQHIADTFLIYGLLLHGHYAEAEPSARKSFSRSDPSDDRHIRVILAWILFEQGKRPEAAELLKVNPVPGTFTAGPFESVLMRKELDLRRELKQ